MRPHYIPLFHMYHVLIFPLSLLFSDVIAELSHSFRPTSSRDDLPIVPIPYVFPFVLSMETIPLLVELLVTCHAPHFWYNR